MASENKNLQRIRKGCVNKEMRRVILAAIHSGARYRMTKAGVLFYGPDGGGISAHLTVSDYRAVENFRQELRKIGIHTQKG